MAETICPVVDGAKLDRHRGAMTMHLLGATSSSALMGIAVGALGAALGAPWGRLTSLVVTAGSVLALLATWGLPVPVLEGRRQVPEWWRTFFGPRTAALLYGAALGLGFPFHLRYGTLAAVAVSVTATGDPLAGAAILGLFGLGRAIAVTPSLRGMPMGETTDLWLNRAALASIVTVACARLAGGAGGGIG